MIVTTVWELDVTFSKEELTYSLEQGGHCGYVFISTENSTCPLWVSDTNQASCLHPCDADNPHCIQGRDLLPQSLSDAAISTR